MTHRHRALVEGDDRGWGACVVGYWHDEGPHGGVVRTQACSCGAVRRVEIAGDHRASSDWDTRWRIIPGAYHGTTDDCAGRYYIDDAMSDAVDRRGRGYQTRRDAAEELVYRV